MVKLFKRNMYAQAKLKAHKWNDFLHIPGKTMFLVSVDTSIGAKSNITFINFTTWLIEHNLAIRRSYSPWRNYFFQLRFKPFSPGEVCVAAFATSFAIFRLFGPEDKYWRFKQNRIPN